MQFNKLYCNGKVDPLGTGKDILLNWNYSNGDERNEKQTAFRITVTDGDTIFDSDIINGDSMSYYLSEHQDIRDSRRYEWYVTSYTDKETLTSPTCRFETASDIIQNADWLICGEDETTSPVFFKEHRIKSLNIASARAYVFGLGFFRLYINGADASNAVLMPPNSRYDKTCYYETFDITDLLKDPNCLFEIQLGSGYNQDYSRFGYRYSVAKGMKAAIGINYCDGSSECVLSDSGWMVRGSNITSNGLYDGECYDARLTDFEAHPAVVSNETAPNGILTSDELPHIKVIRELKPVNRWTTDGCIVYDFGSNISGFSRIKVKAERGCEIRLKHAEMVKADGAIDTETNRDSRSEDVYICRGEGNEIYSPVFTYHGFRYIRVSGEENAYQFSITALMISTDLENDSGFICSEPMINRIHELSVHSMRCNYVSIPTDCPVRDERTPCQMDSQATEEAAIYNFNMSAYYTKWLTDITNADFSVGESNPDWKGDLISLVWRMYLYYNDFRPAIKYYERMKSYLLTWNENRADGVWEKGFGDWCLPNDNTWETIGECRMAVNTSLLYSYAVKLSEIANLLGRNDDIIVFTKIAEDIASSLVRKYLHKNGEINSGRQTEQILPLYFGMLRGEEKQKTVSALKSRLDRERHIDTGGFGTMAFLEALADNGLVDSAFDALTETSYPGYGWQVANGATSLWEQWAYRGIMHSHSHAFFAGIDSSFYRVFCGVRPLSPVFKRFEVKPILPKGMRFAECNLETRSGMIYVKVEKISNGLSVMLTVPANTEAEIVLPDDVCSDEYMLFDGEFPLKKTKKISLGSGTYNFRVIPEKQLYVK